MAVSGSFYRCCSAEDPDCNHGNDHSPSRGCRSQPRLVCLSNLTIGLHAAQRVNLGRVARKDGKAHNLIDIIYRLTADPVESESWKGRNAMDILRRDIMNPPDLSRT